MGLQLFTIRDAMARDVTGTLKRVAALGYEEAETYGFDPEGNRGNSPHSTENMAAFIAGRAGGLKPGQHVSAKGKHPAQVVLSAMNGAGLMAPALGEVKGNLPELFA